MKAKSFAPSPPAGEGRPKARVGARTAKPAPRLVTVREDVLLAMMGRLDSMDATLKKLLGVMPPPTEPTLRELAIKAACGGPKQQDALLNRIEREVAQGRDRSEVLRETMNAL